MIRREPRVEASILSAVLQLLETEGYDGVRMRAVVESAHVSLRTIYKFFPTREELIVAAMERWMAGNSYSRLEEMPPGLPLYEGVMWVLRRVFEPWVRNPEMLRAFHQAQTGVGGARLERQGFAAVGEMAEGLVDRLEPAYLGDFSLVLGLAVRAAVAQCAAGELPTDQIVPVLERVVFRLTHDNAAEARAATPPGIPPGP